MTHRASDIEALLSAFHQLARDFDRNARAPAIAHFPSIVIIGADAEPEPRMHLGHGYRGRGCCDRLRLRHFIADGHRPSDGRAGAAPIRKKIEWRLCPHFLLAHHVRKNLERRASALLSAKSKHRDKRDSGQQKNEKEAAQHI